MFDLYRKESDKKSIDFSPFQQLGGIFDTTQYYQSKNKPVQHFENH